MSCRSEKKYGAFLTISQVAYQCLLSYYHFWGHWYILNTYSKKDFPKISENRLSEKCFDFASGFLLNRIDKTGPKQLFMPTLTKNILHLLINQRLFSPTIWKYSTSRWIWAKNFFENRKLTKVHSSYQIRHFGS